ncbi:MAG: hypothetical protein ACLPGW_07165 [Roseiarcus sp.]
MTQPNEPPAEPVRGPLQSGEPGHEENRDFANIAALVFVVVLELGAFWLFKEIQRHNEILNCVASGRRNCVDIVHPDVPP